MQIEHLLRATLSQLQEVLSGLSNDEYVRPLPILGGSSIGQHTRHIIEFFQVLAHHYENGLINYDNRKRNQHLEASREAATLELLAILDCPSRLDKELLLTGTYSNEVAQELTVRSTYYREIIYNLEHTVHHMAMIKIGIQQSTDLRIPSDFGVAPSTIRHRESVL